MSSTYTSNNGIELMATGDQNNNWGDTNNNNFQLIDQSLDGVVPIQLTSNTYTLTITPGQPSNGRCRVVNFTGSPGGPVAVSIQPSSIQKVYTIINESSQPVILSNGSGSQVTIPASTTAPAFCDGNGNVVGLQAGNNTFSSLAVSGSQTIQGTLAVQGSSILQGVSGTSAAFTSLNVGGQSLSSLISAAIPTLSSLAGSMIMTSVTTQNVSGGSYVIFTFGGNAGTKVQIAFGSGTASDGNTIPVPVGFNTSAMIPFVSLNHVAASSGNNLDSITVSLSGANVTAQSSDNSGHSFTTTANWMAVAWLTGQ